MSRRLLLPAAAVALAAVAAGATWAVSQPQSSGETSTHRTGATATVTRRDLVERETVDGTLGYDDARTLYAAAPGTVTRLARPGNVVTRGQALYWLDARPVTLMYGAVPAWRRLDPSSADGPDIRQLEQNLAALGYDPNSHLTIDDDWDWATTAAVKRWQEDRGLAETGSVELGQIAFLPGPRRIGQTTATVGAPLQPGGEVMDTSSPRRIVSIELDAGKQSLVKRGDQVTIELPDSSTIEGTIAKVGKVAESTTDPQSGEQSDPTIEVTVKLRGSAKVAGLDEAPVAVSIAKATAKAVLAVPVNALLALAEGGYAVEVVDPAGSTHLVRVEPGMFADGFVAISGRGIQAGTKVVVPE